MSVKVREVESEAAESPHGSSTFYRASIATWCGILHHLKWFSSKELHCLAPGEMWAMQTAKQLLEAERGLAMFPEDDV